jgi:hypothetical protein
MFNILSVKRDGPRWVPSASKGRRTRARHHELVGSHGLASAPCANFAAILQHPPPEILALEQPRGHRGQERLSALRGVAELRAPDHGGADPADARFAGVQPDGDLGLQTVRPLVFERRSVGGGRRSDGLLRTREGGGDGVGRHVDLLTASFLEHGWQESLVAGEQGPELLRGQLVHQPQHSPALGHHDGHRARQRSLLRDRARSRELHGEPVGDELEDPFGPLEVLQPVLAEVAQSDARDLLVGDDAGRRL